MSDSIALSVSALVDAPLPEGAPAYAGRLADALRRATPALLALDDQATTRRPAPGKWSPREIIGHLVDSASNNHQRCVRMRERDDRVVEGDDQDAGVSAQRSQEAPWVALVVLGSSYNRHLARLMAATPAVDRERARTQHNLHQRAYRRVPADRAVTLDYFMNDYVDHLEHHLAQVLG
jgi:hypothetical protein